LNFSIKEFGNSFTFSEQFMTHEKYFGITGITGITEKTFKLKFKPKS
jgi:hypothetical protein